MLTNVTCYVCGSENVKTVGFSEYEFEDKPWIEVEAVRCLDCGHSSKIPLFNKHKTIPVPVMSLPTPEEDITGFWYGNREDM